MGGSISDHRGAGRGGGGWTFDCCPISEGFGRLSKLINGQHNQHTTRSRVAPLQPHSATIKLLNLIKNVNVQLYSINSHYVKVMTLKRLV